MENEQTAGQAEGRMNADVKKRWIEALRSGEYQQTRGALRNEEGFCCLGVLCDLYAKETGEQWQEVRGTAYRFLGTNSVLPEQVQEWAGVTSHADIPGGRHDEFLAQYNDRGTSFDKIAAIIEERF